MDELAEIAFPVAVLGEAVWVRVRVERMPALDRQERFAVGQQKIDAIDILSDARSGEASERRLDGVTVPARGQARRLPRRRRACPRNCGRGCGGDLANGRRAAGAAMRSGVDGYGAGRRFP